MLQGYHLMLCHYHKEEFVAAIQTKKGGGVYFS